MYLKVELKLLAEFCFLSFRSCCMNSSSYGYKKKSANNGAYWYANTLLEQKCTYQEFSHMDYLYISLQQTNVSLQSKNANHPTLTIYIVLPRPCTQITANKLCCKPSMTTVSILTKPHITAWQNNWRSPRSIAVYEEIWAIPHCLHCLCMCC